MCRRVSSLLHPDRLLGLPLPVPHSEALHRGCSQSRPQQGEAAQHTAFLTVAYVAKIVQNLILQYIPSFLIGNESRMAESSSFFTLRDIRVYR